jgi:hypothetical protein
LFALASPLSRALDLFWLDPSTLSVGFCDMA